MISLFPLIGSAIAIGRQREHGPQIGGSLHQRATTGRDGFMSKKQARDLKALVERARVQDGPFPGLVPSAGVDFGQPVPSNLVIDPNLVNEPIRRAAATVTSGRYSLTARPGWFVAQVPKDGNLYYPVQVPFAPVAGVRTWVIPCFTDLPQNLFLTPNIYANQSFGIGQTLGAGIDGNNVVFCTINQYGGFGSPELNYWDLFFGAIEDGVMVHSEPIKMCSGAPPVAVVITKGAGGGGWHIEVLLAGNHAAHVSAEFSCDITPDRFAWGALTTPIASHALVRGIQGLYSFDSDELVL